MLERITGDSWEQMVHQVLTTDLVLEAHVGWPVEIDDGQPRGHLPGSYMGGSKDELMVYDKTYAYKNQDVFNPAGHLSMSIADYARFVQMHSTIFYGVGKSLKGRYDRLVA
jgi:CubicO group peptidase (beta-lactamase class C family)